MLHILHVLWWWDRLLCTVHRCPDCHLSMVCVCVLVGWAGRGLDEAAAAWAGWAAVWWISGGLSGQDLMIDTQIGYEVLPATLTPAKPTRQHLQNMKERSRTETECREKERGWEVRREWKSVRRIDRISAREGGKVMLLKGENEEERQKK